MDDLLKAYAVEIYGIDNKYATDGFTLESLISSHRHLRNLNIQNLAEHAAIRQEVREKAEASEDEWLKHGKYIHRDKLLSMTMQEIVEFLG